MNVSENSALHENSVRQLIVLFGENNETMVRTTYDKQRKRLEKEASVHLFVPILACRATVEVLKKKKTGFLPI